MKPSLVDISVLILFFNRPEQLSQVFTQVRKARPARLFLYQDGPRGPQDMPGITACREVVSQVDWDCEVKTLFQDRNFGCDPSEFISQQWAFSQTDKCVVLEDDDVPCVSFFTFCKEMLDRYTHDTRVTMIQGFNVEEHTEDIAEDYFFTSHFSIWGWASWSRVVNKWDEHYTWLDDKQTTQQIETLMKERHMRDDFLPMCRSQGSGESLLRDHLLGAPVTEQRALHRAPTQHGQQPGSHCRQYALRRLARDHASWLQAHLHDEALRNGSWQDTCPPQACDRTCGLSEACLPHHGMDESRHQGGPVFSRAVSQPQIRELPLYRTVLQETSPQMAGEGQVQMKVLMLSTADMIGGGALAAYRLMQALKGEEVDVKMMVRDKVSNDTDVIKVGSFVPKFIERLDVLFHNGWSFKDWWKTDPATRGIDITSTPEFKEADVVHLHWINQGMLSLHGLEKILKSGKKIVWTLHDEWPFRGVCHYRGDCTQTLCEVCPLVKGHYAHRRLKKKLRMYKKAAVTWVGCSQWMADQAQEAMPKEKVTHIPNCVPVFPFCPTGKNAARHVLHLPEQKKIILFGCQNVNDPRKGIHFLEEALDLLDTEDIHLAIVGGGSDGVKLGETVPLSILGTLPPEKIALAYAAADVFVTPSLQDNLPNTIAEAMTVGTPCVGFRVGGIPEMITHKVNGYVANAANSKDLAEGIKYVLNHHLTEAARSFATDTYNPSHVALQYINVYES